MNTDSTVILSSFICLISFIVLQIVFFRMVNRQQVFKWLIVFYAAGGIFPLSVWSGLQISGFSPEILLVIGLSFTCYSMLAFIYILCIFGLADSSLRIRILDYLAEDVTGVGEKELYKRYGKHQIIERRLKRLCSSGEICCRNGKYFTSDRFSYFSIPSALFRKVWDIYRIH